jgi:hypothetical protein
MEGEARGLVDSDMIRGCEATLSQRLVDLITHLFSMSSKPNNFAMWLLVCVHVLAFGVVCASSVCRAFPGLFELVICAELFAHSFFYHLTSVWLHRFAAADFGTVLKRVQSP